jgi:kynurenine 3-monooxygenase
LETLHPETQAPLSDKKHIAVFGGGLVGALLAVLLAQKGKQVQLFEKRKDLRQVKNWDEGRSINLALSERGWQALRLLGLDESVKRIAVPMYGRKIHNEDGKITFQPYGKEGQAIYSVSRGILNSTLLDMAEQYPNIKLNFEQRLLDVDIRTNIAHILKLDTQEEYKLYNDVIFGADGAFSAVRNNLQKTNRFNYSQHYIEHGYKELSIPPTAEGNWALDPNALHIWPRGRFMLIALPNVDKTFTCTLFLDFEGPVSFEQIQDEKSLMQFFLEYFPDTIPIMPHLQTEFFHNPTASLVTIQCYPWCYQDKIALIGDAAHAIVPFFGQGMNAGFEDCSILSEIIDQYHDDWQTILEAYQQSRKVNADAIAELAMQNFLEMRDLVADPKFLLRKKIEAHIYKYFPEEWVPLYSMVTFSNTPYSEALRIGKRQDAIMQKIMDIEDIENIWENLEYGSILKFNKALAGS